MFRGLAGIPWITSVPGKGTQALLMLSWISSSIIGYTMAACCWFPVVYLQIKMRDYTAKVLANGMAYFSNTQSLQEIIKKSSFVLSFF